MVRSAWSLPACALLVLAVGCQDRSAEPAKAPTETVADPATTAPVTAPAPPTPITPQPVSTDAPTGPDAWLGKWTGPEGTFLLLEKREGGGYLVTIQSLDGPASYPGDGTATGIEFERNGKTERIRAGSGKLTGMKWLADKSDCLLIQLGEGFCRDQQPAASPPNENPEVQ
jgi:hypothetical protein